MTTVNGRLDIDLGALCSNYRELARRASPGRCGAVLKADAYGLGAEPIGRALHLAGCRDFFVVLLSEAESLRRALGAEARIYILNGVGDDEVADCIAIGAIPVLNTLSQCRRWASRGRGAAVLQVDSGMSRLGLSPAEQVALLQDRSTMDALDLVLLISHLAVADTPDDAGNAEQLGAFAAARQRFPQLPASLANSAGTWLGPDYRFDLSRPGAALYGIDAGPATRDMQPIVSLYAPVLQLRDVEAGAGIGYGFTARADRPMRLATIGIGYADGWPRSLSSRGAVFWQGQKLPVVGRVSMDSFVVDVTGPLAVHIAEGDMVELIGPHQSADDVAGLAGTIGYEILTGLGPRLVRRYRNGPGKG